MNEQNDFFDIINHVDRKRVDLIDPFTLVAHHEYLQGEPLARPVRMTDREQRNIRSFAFGFI